MLLFLDTRFPQQARKGLIRQEEVSETPLHYGVEQLKTNRRGNLSIKQVVPRYFYYWNAKKTYTNYSLKISLIMKANFNIGKEILKELSRQERSVTWFANKIDDCDPSNLRKQLALQHIRPELLYDISEALKKDFFSFYSQQLSDTLGSNYHLKNR